jgi:hypothetical protein
MRTLEWKCTPCQTLYQLPAFVTAKLVIEHDGTCIRQTANM